jgi:hypothetical protein
MPDNVINIYETRAMVDYLIYEPGVARFLRDLFFPPNRVRLFDTDSIDIEIQRKGRPIACFVKRIEDGNLVENSGYETNNFKTSYLSEFKEIKTGDFAHKRIGETAYNYTSPGIQAQMQAAQDLKDLIDRQNRAEEIMACQVLTTGTFTGRNKDGKAIYQAEFGMKGSHKPILTGDDAWDSPNCKKNTIMEQIRGWIVNLLQKDAGRMPTHLILGENAFNAFLRRVDPDNETGGLNSFRVVRGDVSPRMAEMGVFFLGTFPELANVQVVGYNEWYDDPWDGGTTKPIFPADKALLLSSNARYDRSYGKIEHLEAPDFIARWPWTWQTPNGKKRFVQVESAPLLSPFEIDSIVSATVTAA